jgi:hypothetical protein
MTTWNLHLIGHDLEEDIQAAVTKFVADLESIGHTLESAVLTTDVGQTTVATTPTPADPTQTVGGEPVTSTTPPTDDPGPTTDDPEPVPTDTPPSL